MTRRRTEGGSEIVLFEAEHAVAVVVAAEPAPQKAHDRRPGHHSQQPHATDQPAYRPSGIVVAGQEAAEDPSDAVPRALLHLVHGRQPLGLPQRNLIRSLVSLLDPLLPLLSLPRCHRLRVHRPVRVHPRPVRHLLPSSSPARAWPDVLVHALPALLDLALSGAIRPVVVGSFSGIPVDVFLFPNSVLTPRWLPGASLSLVGSLHRLFVVELAIPASLLLFLLVLRLLLLLRHQLGRTHLLPALDHHILCTPVLLLPLLFLHCLTPFPVRRVTRLALPPSTPWVALAQPVPARLAPT
mmetsp:Transcript_42319/g.99367  ORF Transcript_42319/g.99367 Transcript_42319/m.99367 type:complete len:297 (-) Transcript_42319:185-1075(-)